MLAPPQDYDAVRRGGTRVEETTQQGVSLHVLGLWGDREQLEIAADRSAARSGANITFTGTATEPSTNAAGGGRPTTQITVYGPPSRPLTVPAELEPSPRSMLAEYSLAVAVVSRSVKVVMVPLN